MCNQGVFFVQTDLRCLNANCLGHQVSMIPRLTYSIVLDCIFFFCCFAVAEFFSVILSILLVSIFLHLLRTFLEHGSRYIKFPWLLLSRCPRLLNQDDISCFPCKSNETKMGSYTRKSAGGKQRALSLALLFPFVFLPVAEQGTHIWEDRSQMQWWPDWLQDMGKKSCVVGLVQHWAL